MQDATTPYRDYRSALHQSIVIWQLFNRQSELLRLVAWAKRKRLSHPRQLYCNRLMEEEYRLNHYTLLHPKLVTVLRRGHRLYRLLMPAKKVYRRGAAQKYRREH